MCGYEVYIREVILLVARPRRHRQHIGREKKPPFENVLRSAVVRPE